MKAWGLQTPSSCISWRDASCHSGYDSDHDQIVFHNGGRPQAKGNRFGVEALRQNACHLQVAKEAVASGGGDMEGGGQGGSLNERTRKISGRWLRRKLPL